MTNRAVQRDTGGDDSASLKKVPAVTLGFWIIKVFATTLGETGGDAVTMTLGLGYLVGTAIFAAVLIAAIWAQIAAMRIHPFIYWFAIITTTTSVSPWPISVIARLASAISAGPHFYSRC